MVVWFSAGAPSAVAAKMTLAKGPCVIAYTDPGSEHPDNERFIRDCEEWFGQEVVRLRSDRYVDTWDVWERTRYLVGPEGARCTGELKRGVQLGFKNANCIGCCKASGFGYWNRIRRHFPEVFERMAKLERDIGHSICAEEVTEGSRAKTPVWLDELDPERGDYESENSPECSLLCVIAEGAL